MVRIDCGNADRYTFQQDRQYGELPDPFNEPLAYLSHTVWLNCTLKEIPQAITDLRVRVTFESNQQGDIASRYSKAGFFISHQDVSTNNSESKIGVYDHCINTDFSPNVLVPVDNWKFGNRPSVRLKLPNTSRTSMTTIPIKLGIVIASSPKVEPSEVFNVTVRVDAKENNQPFQKDLVTNTIKFSVDVTDDQCMDEELEHIEGLDAYNIHGCGHSIHPKQTMTIGAFLEEIKNRSNGLRIAYIGTDTLENITSLLRSINESNEKDKISHLDVYLSEDWDTIRLNRIRSSIQNIHSIIPNTRIIHMKIDEENQQNYRFLIDGDQEQAILPEPCDVTVATYVAPWAGQNEQSKKRFITLINQLVTNPEASLLSVDPKSAKEVVRGGFVRSFDITGTYTASRFVKRPMELYYNEDNSSVRVRKFVRMNGDSHD